MKVAKKLHDHLLASIGQAFSADGWKVEYEPEIWNMRPDLRVSKGECRYIVELKAHPESRRPVLRALLADAVLQARKMAGADKASPLAIVGSRSVSAATLEYLSEYARRFADGTCWGVVDASGKISLFGHGLEGVSMEASAKALTPRQSVPLRVNPFSDLGQWLLKVLLAQPLAPDLISAPRSRFMTAGQLGRAADVSVPNAYRIIKALRSEGYVQEWEGKLEIVRFERLLERWRTAVSSNYVELPARWILPRNDKRSQLLEVIAEFYERRNPAPSTETSRRSTHGDAVRWGQGPRVCHALFSACKLLGYGHVHGAPSHVYIEDLSPDVLNALGLWRAEPGDAVDVFLRRPRFPESVFRGSVMRGGVPVCDVIQCWLDVMNHPARGSEQGEVLYSQALEPRLRSGMI